MSFQLTCFVESWDDVEVDVMGGGGGEATIKKAKVASWQVPTVYISGVEELQVLHC
jgi:hypothetical protein